MTEDLLIKLNENIEELNNKLKFFNKNVFNAKEAAEYLRVSYGTVLTHTRIGRIEHVKNGTSYIYKKEYLDNWLDENKRRAEVR